MDNETYKTRVEYGVGAVVLLVGLFFIYQAFTIETSRESIGPRTLPLILAVSLVLGGIWLFLRALLGKTGYLKDGYGFRESNVQRHALHVWRAQLGLDDSWRYYSSHHISMGLYGRYVIERP